MVVYNDVVDIVLEHGGLTGVNMKVSTVKRPKLRSMAPYDLLDLDECTTSEHIA